MKFFLELLRMIPKKPLKEFLKTGLDWVKQEVVGGRYLFAIKRWKAVILKAPEVISCVVKREKGEKREGKQGGLVWKNGKKEERKVKGREER